LTVPLDQIGFIEVEALIFAGHTGFAVPTTVLIAPPANPSSMSVYPSSISLSSANEVVFLSVAAQFGSSIIDVSRAGTGTTYGTKNGSSVVNVNTNGVVTGTAPGTDTITITSFGLKTTVPVTVSLTNRPPTIAVGPDLVMPAGAMRDALISGSDPDNQGLAFSASNLPAFATLFDDGKGAAVLHLRPTLNDVGAYVVWLAVTDSGNPSLGAGVSLTIRVTQQEGSPRRRAVTHP